ncbi:hypothetical protein M0Q97_10085 [Candidatus Dojkabacteria bacterium]|jgi:hypothetical protein|nr:hypothetical protein [Candidatus Dojkabacteria bacterium]
MNTEKETAINDFLGNEIEPQDKIESDKKKVIKSDNSIIERIDKIIIAENGKQLLREQY